MWKRWSEKEDDYLIEHCHKGVNYCATALSRSSLSIECRLSRLKLFTRRVWTNDKLIFLKEHYSQDGGPALCSKHLNLTDTQISLMASKQRLKLSQYELSKRISSFDYDGFSVNKPDCCYALGMLWADGHLSKNTYRINLTLVEKDFLDILDIFPQNRGWAHRRLQPKNRQPVIQARASHVLFYNFLEENDYLIKSGASANKILSCIPDSLKHYWWRGYFDGDGWFNYCSGLKYSFGISSCLNQEWDFFESLSSSLGFSRHFISRRESTKGNSSQVLCSNFESTYRFGKFIYQGYDQDMIGLKRKHETFVNLVQAKNSHVHKSI